MKLFYISQHAHQISLNNHPAKLLLASIIISKGPHFDRTKIWVDICDIGVDVGVKILCQHLYEDSEKHVMCRQLQVHDDSFSNDCQTA